MGKKVNTWCNNPLLVIRLIGVISKWAGKLYWVAAKVLLRQNTGLLYYSKYTFLLGKVMLENRKCFSYWPNNAEFIKEISTTKFVLKKMGTFTLYCIYFLPCQYYIIIHWSSTVKFVLLFSMCFLTLWPHHTRQFWNPGICWQGSLRCR